MAISILESFEVVQGGSYSLTQVGMVVLVGNGETSFASRPLVGVTLGGVPFVEAVKSGATDPKGGVWYIKEADVPTSPMTLSADWDGNLHNPLVGTLYVLGGVDQSAPIVGTSENSDIANGNEIDLTLDTLSDGFLAVSVGTYSSLVSVNQSATTASSSPPLTYDMAKNESSYSAFVMSSSVLVDGLTSVGVRLSGTDINKSYAAAASFRPATTDNIDTDNEVDQFQRNVALNHSLASPLTSVLINNVEHIDLIQNADAELKYIKRCYDAIGSDVTSVILKNGVDTDVPISNVTVNTTHPYPVPNEAVDSNSMFSGVTVSGDNAAFRITSQPTKGTLDLSDPAKYLHDVDASKGGVYTPNAGATGTDSFTFEVHDPDEPVALNRTQSGTVTINLVGGIISIDFDNTVYLTQETSIQMSGSADSAVKITLGGKEQTIGMGATSTSLPVTISNDLPYGLHQLIVETA